MDKVCESCQQSGLGDRYFGCPECGQTLCGCCSHDFTTCKTCDPTPNPADMIYETKSIPGGPPGHCLGCSQPVGNCDCRPVIDLTDESPKPPKKVRIAPEGAKCVGIKGEKILTAEEKEEEVKEKKRKRAALEEAEEIMGEAGAVAEWCDDILERLNYIAPSMRRISELRALSNGLDARFLDGIEEKIAYIEDEMNDLTAQLDKDVFKLRFDLGLLKKSKF